ncbi:flagellin [Deferribacter thermophilus]|uniref:flagellin n=1 Tax=Deferribacter thermophilus TaxID=53573 RepID=UPI003C1647FA
MRVTFNTLYIKNQDNIRKSLERMTIANDKVNKGRNLLNPESDPVYYASAINIQRMIDEMEQFKRNADNALTWLTNEDNELQNASSLISKAKNEYALAGLNDSQNETSRKALAGDVKNILDSMVSIGNANYFGRYIFAGYKTDTKPFSYDNKEIKGVTIDSGSQGLEIIKKRTFADLKEIDEGNYTVDIQKVNGSAELIKVILYDSSGNKVFIDSNSSDESAKNGNIATTEMYVKYSPNKVINLGVGFGIKLSEDNFSDFQGAKISFNYKPGDDIRYHGDEGKINAKIGYSQDVTLNLTGKDVFLATNRILKGTGFNTINGLPITETAKFLEIDNINVSEADYIEVSGTDHLGMPVGVAKLWSANSVVLDMTKATEDERTITVEYGGYSEKITLDQKAYEDVEAVVDTINNKLSNQGLGDYVIAYADGDKILLATTEAGAYVRLTVIGSQNNKLGFEQNPGDSNFVAFGKSRRFFFGYDDFEEFDSNNLSPMFNSFDNLSPNTDYKLIINGVEVLFSTGSNIQDTLNNIESALKDKGLLKNIKVDVGNGSINGYKITLEYLNVDKGNDIYFDTSLYDSLNNLVDHDFSTPRSDIFPSYNESKSVGDFLKFIENLYDNSVDASISEGQLIVEDLRDGISRFTLNINESNTGIGYPEVNKNVVFSGKYTGGVDSTWHFEYDYNNDILKVTSGTSTIKEINNFSANYSNKELDLGYGVKVLINSDILNTDVIFDLALKANSNLNFGDMNIIQDGENVNVFKTLKNLYDALDLNIAQGGIGAPSAWRDENFRSTANPFLDGEFRGNYNDKWVYQVESVDNKNEFFLQNELTYSVNSPTDFSNLNFTLNIKTNDSIVSLNYPIDFDTSGVLDVNTFIDALNQDSDLRNYGITVSFDDQNNKILFNSGKGTQEISVTTNDNNTANQFFGDTNYINTVFGQKDATIDLSDYPHENVILTIYDNNGSEHNISIKAKNYSGIDELKSTIQYELDANGISVTVGNVGNRLVLTGSGSFSNLHVSGDYEGTLGFYKAGDEVKIKVSSEPTGELINEVSLDTAGKTYEVADGVKLGFDKGDLYATDSFTATVGSGIDYELPILDRAETQIGEALTIVGTRQNRVDSVINFHTTFTTSNEELKAKYLGSREVDITDAITQLQLAQQAYHAALAATSRLLQISILDFLR